MSILNPTSDGNIEVLWSVAKFLCQNGPTNFSKLMDTFVVEEPKYFQNTIRRWDQLGVIVQTGDEVCMSGDFDEVSILNFEHNFPQILRRQILLEKNNPKDQFFGQELNLASDFTRMAAWMMLQQPSKFSLIFRKFDTLQTEMNKQLDVVSSDDAEFINDVRYGQLKRWCNLLGLIQGQSNLEFLDATVAIRSELDSILAKIVDKARQDGDISLYPARDFMAQLKVQLPVLDGGVYQNRILSVSRAGMVSIPSGDTASQVVSLALLRLEKARLLKLHQRADATGIMLEFGEGRTRKLDYIERLQNE